ARVRRGGGYRVSLCARECARQRCEHVQDRCLLAREPAVPCSRKVPRAGAWSDHCWPGKVRRVWTASPASVAARAAAITLSGSRAVGCQPPLRPLSPERGRQGASRRAPGEHPRPLDSHPVFGVEVAQEPLQVAQALQVEELEVDAVAASRGALHLGADPLDEPALVVLAAHLRLGGEQRRDLGLALLAEECVERAAEGLHPALQAEALARLVELRDEVGLHAKRQHLEVHSLAVGAPVAARPDRDAALLRLPHLPDEVALVRAAGGAPDDLEVERLELRDRELREPPLLGASVAAVGRLIASVASVGRGVVHRRSGIERHLLLCGVAGRRLLGPNAALTGLEDLGDPADEEPAVRRPRLLAGHLGEPGLQLGQAQLLQGLDLLAGGAGHVHVLLWLRVAWLSESPWR